MAEIFFPFQSLLAQELLGSDTAKFTHFSRNNALACNKLMANFPYCLPGDYPAGREVTETISRLPIKTREHLIRTIDTFGEFTSSLAEFYCKNLASLSVSTDDQQIGYKIPARTSANDFPFALLRYQQALMDLKKYQQDDSVSAQKKSDLKHQVKVKYELLQRRYQDEIKDITSAAQRQKRSQRFSQWRPGRGLFIADNKQAEQIVQFAHALRYVGKGIVTLDTGRGLQEKFNLIKHEESLQLAPLKDSRLGHPWGVYSQPKFSAKSTAVGLGYTPTGWVMLIGVGAAARFTAAYFLTQ